MGKAGGEGNVLLLVAKAPVAGRVKTRLCPGDHDHAARLAAAFLEDTAALLTHPALPARVVVALDGDPNDLPEPLRSFPAVAQGGGDLGERLTRLFADQFAAQGTNTVCVIGGDTPHLPVAFLVEAFSRLDGGGTDAVFGPTDDGGYYLAGMNRPLPPLFVGIPWSSPDVLKATLERAAAAATRTRLLPPWYDMDTPDDLERLAREVRRGTVTAPGTAAVLEL